MGTKIVPGVLAQASRALRRYAQAYRSLVRLSNVWPSDGSFADSSTARDLLLQDRGRFVERRRVIGLDVRWYPDVVVLRSGLRASQLLDRDRKLCTVAEMVRARGAEEPDGLLPDDRRGFFLLELHGEDLGVRCAPVVENEDYRKLICGGQSQVFVP